MKHRKTGWLLKTGLFTIAIMASALGLGFGRAPGASSPDIGLRLLNPEKKIIPIYFAYDDSAWRSDIKLPPIVVENTSGADVILESCRVIGTSGGREVIRMTIGKEQAAGDVRESAAALNRLLADPHNPWKAYNLKKLFGRVQDNGKFGETDRLQPGEKVSLSFGNAGSLQYAGPGKVDGLIIRVSVGRLGMETSADLPLPLTPYACKGKYFFPVPGSATISGTPISGHRILQSSEFAMDICDYRRLADGTLSLSDPPRSTKVADYFAFNRDIIAVGDGVVVMTGNGWPDEPMDNPLLYSEDRVSDLTVNLIEKGVEFQNAYIGNYIIIDHENGEFSAYAHLKQNSLTVRPGDRVTRGQVIGRIGNTANSTDPHCHFQLMDSGDYASANGLPVMFADLPSPQPSAWDMTTANTIFYSDYLFVYTSRPGSDGTQKKK